MQIISLKQAQRDAARRGFDLWAYLNDQYGNRWTYIGRPARYHGRHLPASPLANPFRRHNQPRGSTLAAYRHHLWQQLQAGDQAVVDALRRLPPDAVLVCWCDQPGPCHGHVVKAAADWLRSQSALSTAPEQRQP